jgi:hypothetical protein
MYSFVGSSISFHMKKIKGQIVYRLSLLCASMLIFVTKVPLREIRKHRAESFFCAEKSHLYVVFVAWQVEVFSES